MSGHMSQPPGGRALCSSCSFHLAQILNPSLSLFFLPPLCFYRFPSRRLTPGTLARLSDSVRYFSWAPNGSVSVQQGCFSHPLIGSTIISLSTARLCSPNYFFDAVIELCAGHVVWTPIAAPVCYPMQERGTDAVLDHTD